MQGPLIAAQQLARRLEATPPPVVLDATLWLPHEGRDARAAFAEAHVPGARFFDIESFSDPETDLPHMVPGAGRFARLAGELGIDGTAAVVVYDQRGLFSAPRAWWLLRLFGHERVCVLDGGLPAWRHAGLPLESGEPPPPAPARFRPTPRLARVRGIGDMLAAAAEDVLVLDARAAARFSGLAPEPRPGLRAGHIPGARNVPYASLVDADGLMLAAAELRERLLEAGVDGTRQVVTYCGSGVTAAVVTLALVAAGFGEGALYDGSWSEWGGRADTPVET